MTGDRARPPRRSPRRDSSITSTVAAIYDNQTEAAASTASLVFALLGHELVKVVTETDVTHHSVVLAGLVVLTLILVSRIRARRRRVPWPSSWRESAVVSWAGMRGVVTVAAASALPESVTGGALPPGRDEIVVVVLSVVLVTLVAQVLTLAPLTSALGVGRQGDGSAEVAELRREAAPAALDHLRAAGLNGVSKEVSRAATLQYEGYLSAQGAIETARCAGAGGADHEDATDQLRSVLRAAMDVERALVLDARRRGRATPASTDEVLRAIGGRALRDFG